MNARFFGSVSGLPLLIEMVWEAYVWVSSMPVKFIMPTSNDIYLIFDDGSPNYHIPLRNISLWDMINEINEADSDARELGWEPDMIYVFINSNTNYKAIVAVNFELCTPFRICQFS